VWSFCTCQLVPCRLVHRTTTSTAVSIDSAAGCESYEITVGDHRALDAVAARRVVHSLTVDVISALSMTTFIDAQTRTLIYVVSRYMYDVVLFLCVRTVRET